MKILAVETATSLQSVAVLENGQPLAVSSQDAGRSHGRTLVSVIRKILESVNLRLHQLDAFAVSSGPGSFTGLRVGFATVAALRTATGLPIVSVPTLEGMAWNLRHITEPVCPMLPSRTGEIYWAIYQWNGSKLKVLLEVRAGNFEEWGLTILESSMCLGQGFMENKEAVAKVAGTFVRQAPDEAHGASAVSVGLAAMERYREGDFAKMGFSPEYVQPPAAVKNFKPSPKYPLRVWQGPS